MASTPSPKRLVHLTGRSLNVHVPPSALVVHDSAAAAFAVPEIGVERRQSLEAAEHHPLVLEREHLGRVDLPEVPDRERQRLRGLRASAGSAFAPRGPPRTAVEATARRARANHGRIAIHERLRRPARAPLIGADSTYVSDAAFARSAAATCGRNEPRDVAAERRHLAHERGREEGELDRRARGRASRGPARGAGSSASSAARIPSPGRCERPGAEARPPHAGRRRRAGRRRARPGRSDIGRTPSAKSAIRSSAENRVDFPARATAMMRRSNSGGGASHEVEVPERHGIEGAGEEGDAGRHGGLRAPTLPVGARRRPSRSRPGGRAAPVPGRGAEGPGGETRPRNEGRTTACSRRPREDRTAR